MVAVAYLIPPLTGFARANAVLPPATLSHVLDTGIVPSVHDWPFAL
jgi:hypothetical protein